MITTNYNPDVLSCIANLSNDEVFTPPKLVNEILDQLPTDLWSNPSITFLDPVSKSGVFLREIIKRLMKGLESKFPENQERVNHILKNQVYGIAITELTSLLSRRSVYCSKSANGKYSITNVFDKAQGNIIYDRIEHTWENGKCIFCNASKEVYERDSDLETYAYQFIHANNPEDIYNMKFDVIVGNPPYQLSDGGHGRSASPIYHKFIQQAKLLNPKYLTMIIPARWFAGGKGLDNFRNEMLSDKRIQKLVDFENSNEVFPGVDVAGGICYFLWERDSEGPCEVTNKYNGKKVISIRPLNEYSIFIRQSQAVPILRKITEEETNFLNDFVSPSKPFGIRTFYKPTRIGIPCWFTQKLGRQKANFDDITDRFDLLDKWKLLLPKAPIAGQTDFSKPVRFYYDGNVRIAKPGECCTESWIVAGAFKTEEEVLSYKSYLFTKVVRFLLLQTVISQDVTRKNFQFIPHLGLYTGEFTDEHLIQKWNITDEEWQFIDSKIR